MVKNLGRFCWNELAASDIKKAKFFYGKLFGWDFEDVSLNNASYTLLKADDEELGGIWHIPAAEHQHIPPHWMSYVLVDNLEASLEIARQFGAEIMKDITEIGDRGYLAIITDPMGAHLALWENKAHK